VLLWTVWTVRLLTLNAYTSLLRILSHSLSSCPPTTTPTIPPTYLYICVSEFLHSNDLGKMLVVLRDGRKLHGVLRSYDQFGMSLSLSLFLTKSMTFFWFSLWVDFLANLVLEDTVERIYHGTSYAENWHGLFLIRGENVVLLGEIVRCSHLVLFFTPRIFLPLVSLT